MRDLAKEHDLILVAWRVEKDESKAAALWRALADIREEARVNHNALEEEREQ